MGFYNILMLIGLAGVAIPVILHLLNRRRARVIDWGAMQFLLGSAAARNRRILIEEIILMILRCGLVALVVLAMARPFLSARPVIPWMLVLPLVFVAVICLAIAGSIRSRQRRARWVLLLVAGGLLGIAGAASAAEYVLQKRFWPAPDGGKDVAIVLDGSTSMHMPAGDNGRLNFDRAVAEARHVIDACNPADTIALVIAGGRAHGILPAPTSDRDAVRKALDALRDGSARAPAAGTLDAPGALAAAARQLRAGHHPAKKVVLITDAQHLGWSVGAPEAWVEPARALRQQVARDARPQVICRTLPPPKHLANATVEQVRFSRTVIGVGRPVDVTVTVRNVGDVAVPGGQVVLEAAGRSAQRDAVGEIQPTNSRVATFTLTFDAPGRHVVSARFLGDDAIAADNSARRVVEVIDTIDALVVGATRPSRHERDRAAFYLARALAPGPARAAPPADKRPDAPDRVRSPFAVTSVAARDLAEHPDLQRYRVIVLADVPALPEAAAGRLGDYVAAGGGLLIAAGTDADPAFYNHWSTPDGMRVAPAKLADERRVCPEPPGLAPETLTLPGMTRLVAHGDSEVDAVSVEAYRPLTTFGNAPLEAYGSLTNDDAILAGGRCGRGAVLMLPVGFDVAETNWQRTYFFVPFVHECAHHLAETSGANWNVRPGNTVTLPLPAGTKTADARGITVVRIRRDPDGAETSAGPPMPVEVAQDARHGPAVRFARTSEPGLYRFRLPEPLAAAWEHAPAARTSVPFVVTRDPRESHLAWLLPADMAKVAGYLDASGVRLDRAGDVEQLEAMVAGRIPGGPLWAYFALGALAALIGEIALTRWIAAQRRSHTVEPVAFGATDDDARSYRARAKAMVSLPDASHQHTGHA
ncbi:MAG: BatA domain-containing protein [Phycisphaerae bacterium]|nr:BatA domain-containing protein [Phycisphaerae bacterium]